MYGKVSPAPPNIHRKSQTPSCSIKCAIDAIVEGVVTLHFPATDDLIQAVITTVIADMSQYLEPRWKAATPVDPQHSPHPTDPETSEEES